MDNEVTCEPLANSVLDGPSLTKCVSPCLFTQRYSDENTDSQRLTAAEDSRHERWRPPDVFRRRSRSAPNGCRSSSARRSRRETDDQTQARWIGRISSPTSPWRSFERCQSRCKPTSLTAPPLFIFLAAFLLVVTPSVPVSLLQSGLIGSCCDLI